MASALDRKGRDVLTEGQITVLAMLYSSLQGHLHDADALNEDLKSTHMFLDALAMCGIAVLTQASVDELWGTLSTARKQPL